MDTLKITSKDFLKKVKEEKTFKPTTLQDREGTCIDCGANRSVTFWDDNGVLTKYIIVSCEH